MMKRKKFKCSYCYLEFENRLPAYWNGNKCCSVCFAVLKRNKGDYVTPIFPEDKIPRDNIKPYLLRRTDKSKLKQRLSIAKKNLNDTEELLKEYSKRTSDLLKIKNNIQNKIERLKLSLLKHS